jgi:hypothetical protein
MTWADIWVLFKHNGGFLWSVVTFVGGLLVGNWLAIGRDKRKEWNELTRECFKGLHLQIESEGQRGTLDGDLVIIETYIPFYKKYFYRRCLKKYQSTINKTYGEYDPQLGMSKINHENCKQAVIFSKALLRYFKPR